MQGWDGRGNRGGGWAAGCPDSEDEGGRWIEGGFFTHPFIINNFTKGPSHCGFLRC
jgi:hypothetical protein